MDNPSAGDLRHAIESSAASCWRVLRAYATRLRPQWPFLVFGLGFTALAVVNTQRSTAKQIVFPAPTWGLIALGCLSAAQFVVWLGMRHDPVEAHHGERLRRIAGQLQAGNVVGSEPRYMDGDSSDPILERMFQAHYPGVAVQVQRGRDASLHARAARTAFQHLIATEGLIARFPQTDGWKPHAISTCALNFMDDILGKQPLHLSSPTSGGSMSWPTTNVWQATDQGLSIQDAEHELRDWATKLTQSPEALAVRDAHEAVKTAREEAQRQLEPILHDAPVKRSRRCEICYPR